MIRILHVVPTLNINSGMMSVVMNYYRNIDRNKIQFDFLYFGYMKDNHGEEIERLGGRLYYMERPTFKPGDQKRLRKFFAEHKGEFTAVHCHPIWSSIVVAREAKHSGIKHIIQHAHSTNYSEKRISALRNRFLMKFIRLFATDYIACNSEAANLFGRKGLEKSEVIIIPNAIDIKKYSYDEELRALTRAEFEASPSTIILGNVGRFSIEKNQCFIVEIFKEFQRLKSDSKLVLVGDGSYRKNIEEKIKELELEDRVILTGKRKDIRAILSGMDIFIMPSLFEGTPVSALEARSSGLPCLLSDTITRCVEMDGIKYFTLKKEAEIWARFTLDFYNERALYDRHDYNVVVDHGYSISSTAETLQKYYLEL